MAKILLVEDEIAVREMLMDELTAQGHAVVEAANGAEGLQSLLDETPDLVLCDRTMPVMSGYDLLAKLRKDYPQYNKTPFVFLTALADPRDKGAVEHLQPSAYIEKPIDFTRLAEKIAELLGNGLEFV